jgi:ADP-ribose pyrophosphatase YjhB (NUDIX family)
MISQDQIIADWTKHPTGKIPTGEFCSHCGRYNTRNSTATMLVLNHRNQALLIKRKRDPQAGWWAMPGGYLDWNETLADCAKRELKEETGLVVNRATLLGVYDALDRDKDGRQNIDHCYISKLINDQVLIPNVEEVSDIRFFSPEKLPDNIAFDHRQMIEDYYGRPSNH